MIDDLKNSPGGNRSMKGENYRAGKSPFSSCKNSRVFDFSISDKEDSGKISADHRQEKAISIELSEKRNISIG